MPHLPSLDLSVIRSGRILTPRKFYVAVDPMTEIFAGQLDGAPLSDAQTLGYYATKYNNVSVGSYGLYMAEMTAYFGTTPGAHDLGITRMRKTPSADTLFVPESAPSTLALANDAYFSVRQSYRPWLRLPKGVALSSNGQYTTDVTMLVDYDRAYDLDNQNFTPKANITRAANKRFAPKPAGFVDGYRTALPQNYRTMTFSAAYSFTLTDGQSIDGYTWAIGDGTFVSGGINTCDVTVTFPVGFRWICLQVSSYGKNGLIYFPVWVFDADHMPLSRFTRTRDWTGDWREQELEFFQQDTAETTIPKGAAVCIFEDDPFWGDDIPDQYRDQMLGWCKEDTTLFRKYQSRDTLVVTGLGEWLNRFRAIPQRVADPGRTAATWFEMQNITCDKLSFYLMENFCTGNLLGNMYLSGITDRLKSLDLTGQSLLGQIQYAPQGYYGRARFDSLNQLWIKRHYDYMTADERLTVDTIVNLSGADWSDSSAPKLIRKQYTAVAGLLGAGGSFDGTTQTIYNARAPGRTPAESATEQDAPGQNLPFVSGKILPTDAGGAQEKLTFLTAAHYNHLNKNNDSVNIDMLYNIDVFEPAWNEPVTVTTSESQSGMTLAAQAFLIKEISITYDDPYSSQGKKISLTLEEVTSGSLDGAQWDKVPVDATQPPIDPPPEIVIPPSAPVTIPPSSGVLPYELWIMSASHARAARVNFDALGNMTAQDRSTGLLAAAAWFNSNPYAFDEGFAYTKVGGGIEHIAAQGDGFTTADLRMSNDDLWGSSSDYSWYGRMSHLVNGQGLLMHKDLTYRAVTGDAWRSRTKVANDFGYICMAPLNPNVWYGVKQVNSGGLKIQIWRSHDGGLTFPDMLAEDATNSYALFISAPYKRPGGVLNVEGEGFLLHVGGNNRTLRECITTSGVMTFGAALLNGYNANGSPSLGVSTLAPNPVAEYTHDAAITYWSDHDHEFGADYFRFGSTPDNFVTRSVVGASGSFESAFVDAMNFQGWPPNSNCVVRHGDNGSNGNCQFSLDAGVTWYTVDMHALLGWDADERIAYVEFRLATVQ